MAIKKDLSINFLGVKCGNPFFLSSSAVGGNYDMIAKSFETGWGGCVYKSVATFVGEDCSPRFASTDKEGMKWLGFKNLTTSVDATSAAPIDTFRRTG